MPYNIPKKDPPFDKKREVMTISDVRKKKVLLLSTAIGILMLTLESRELNGILSQEDPD